MADLVRLLKSLTLPLSPASRARPECAPRRPRPRCGRTQGRGTFAPRPESRQRSRCSAWRDSPVIRGKTVAVPQIRLTDHLKRLLQLETLSRAKASQEYAPKPATDRTDGPRFAQRMIRPVFGQPRLRLSTGYRLPGIKNTRPINPNNIRLCAGWPLVAVKTGCKRF